VDMRLLATCVTEFADELRAAIQAVLLMRMSVGGTGRRLDCACEYRAGCRVPNRFQIGHSASPWPDIMRPSALMLALPS
jgi:hypothetical protein